MRNIPGDCRYMTLVASEKSLALGIFFLPLMTLTAPTGYSYPAVILLLAALTQHTFLPGVEKHRHHLSFPAKLIISSLLLYAAFWIGDAAVRGEGLRGFDRPSRFIIAAFCLVAVSRARINAEWFWAGLSFGSIGAGAIALWQWAIGGVARVSGFAPTNKFGLIAITMGLMCLSGLIWASNSSYSRKRKLLTAGLLIFGSCLGLTAAMLSGSRGAWIALIPSTLVYLLVIPRVLKVVYSFSLIAVLALFLTLLALILPTDDSVNRLKNASSQLNTYLEGNFTEGPVGYRLDMWKGAILLFNERPYIGWGELGYASRMQDLENNGALQKGTADYAHAHNDWFNVLAKKGLTGGVVLLSVYVVPLFFFIQIAIRAVKGNALDTFTLALATSGIVLVLSFISGGVAQVPFGRNIGIMFYGFMMASLVGLLSHQRSP